MSGVDIPFGESGGNERALAQMINCHRWFGNGAFFVTFNPVIQDSVFALRLAVPVCNNYGDCTGQNFAFPSDAMERRRIIDAHPNAASQGYITIYDAFRRCLVGLPVSDTGRRSNTAMPVPSSRPRGLFGPALGLFDAQETSQSGAQHTHCELYTPVTWNAIKRIAHDPELNVKIGQYFESIICTHLELDEESKFPEFDEKFSSDPTFLEQLTAVTTRSDPAFKKGFIILAAAKQDHSGHNFSCFRKKKSAELCRFGYPQHSIDQVSTIAQLRVDQLSDSDNKCRSVKILGKVESPPALENR